ncbi:MAG: hypothetical protein OEN23_00515 [Paracoccaceae bacterium]|nr:hypothetical protein [Paracoccaceae bacterium]
MRRLIGIMAMALLAPLPASAEEYAPGEKLTMINCGRCHVVSDKDRMAGIGSTPSFAVIRTWDNWEDKMKAFWTYRPHPAFTQVEGMTAPFPESRPSPIHPIQLTLAEVETIVEYARTIEPADLGADLGLK